MPETRFPPPGYDLNAAPAFGDDISGLESPIYYIMTGHYPYQERPSDEAGKLCKD